MLFKPESVRIEPDCELTRWTIFKTPKNTFRSGHTYHLAGNVGGYGRVSSPIESFSREVSTTKVKHTFTTRSGRVYKVYGEQDGLSKDTCYVLGAWLHGNRLSIENIEYLSFDNFVTEWNSTTQ